MKEGDKLKTKDLIDLLEKNGFQFKRHGGDHDVYVRGKERECVVITVKQMKNWPKQLLSAGD